ncbi:MAG: hypothetical protein KA163_02485 [Bacteroidia bacterium]|nr:hypothetical protein [Bacteroidia bacterium]
MNFLKKYICELVFAINIFLIPFNHDLKIWWQRPIVNDAMGYYAYLPAIFIYHDLSYNCIEEPWLKHNKDVPGGNDFKASFIVKYKGKEVNKYPPGVTYFQAPFFFMAHASALLFNAEPDGYSDIYMWFMCVGSIFWQYIFFKLIWRIFQHYNLSRTAFAITVPLLSFGTNLYFYTQIFGCYSHLYTLLSTTLFFYSGLKFFENFPNPKSSKYFFVMAIALALAIITRNLNGIVIALLPCMGFKAKEILNYFSILKNKLALSGFILSLTILFSMLYLWKLQSGHWLIDSYPDEHFNWGQPQIFKSLFSAHKGWFFYTPLALISLFGLFFMPKKLGLNILLMLSIVVYITSSWGCWDYGTGFSMRAYIDWYLIIALGLGYLIHHSLQNNLQIYTLSFLFVILTALNILWSEQFLRGIISGTSQGIEYSIKNFFRLRPVLEFQISKRTIEKSVFVRNEFNEDPQHPYADVSDKIQFSKGMDLQLDDYLPGNSYTNIRFGAKAKLNDLNHRIFLCTSVTSDKDSLIIWQQINILFFPKVNEWENLESGFQIPKDLPPHCRLKVFFWEPEGNTVAQIDDMYVEFVKAFGE